MKVQELINLLNTLPDKTSEAVVPYDGSFYSITSIDNRQLYSNDNGTNIYDYKEIDSELYNSIVLNYFK